MSAAQQAQTGLAVNRYIQTRNKVHTVFDAMSKGEVVAAALALPVCLFGVLSSRFVFGAIGCGIAMLGMLGVLVQGAMMAYLGRLNEKTAKLVGGVEGGEIVGAEPATRKQLERHTGQRLARCRRPKCEAAALTKGSLCAHHLNEKRETLQRLHLAR